MVPYSFICEKWIDSKKTRAGKRGRSDNKVLALWNFKSLCQISEQGGTCLICGKMEKGSDITREGDES